MLRRAGTGPFPPAAALGASVGVHLVIAAAVVWLLPVGALDGGALDRFVVRTDRPPAAELAPPVEVALFEAADAQLVLPALASSVAGDSTRSELHPRAPTTAPNPDPALPSPAASSGDGPGARELDVTGRRDAERMRVQLADASAGYRLQRIRTGALRESREIVRATPHPAVAPELSSLPGAGRARLLPGARAVGLPRLAPAAAHREGALTPLAALGDRRRAVEASPPRGEPARKIGKDGDEATGFQRPEIARGPAATEAPLGDRVGDRTTSAALSSELHPRRLELSRPAAAGEGEGGRGEGARPAWAARGRGDEAVPAGDPSAPTAEELALATHRRRYEQYLSEVRRRVDPLWELPHEIALSLEQGEVIVSYTIRRDGRLRDVQLVKSSGFRRFDDAVMTAIRRAAPFHPLPSGFGDELRLTSSFDGQNPVVR